ncbi:MAG: histone [Nanoarchaeota archaeon]
MASSRLIPLASLEALMKKAGASRVSQDAKKALKDVLEQKGFEITKDAIELAKHARRKTVRGKDVLLAAKH